MILVCVICRWVGDPSFDMIDIDAMANFGSGYDLLCTLLINFGLFWLPWILDVWSPHTCLSPCVPSTVFQSCKYLLLEASFYFLADHDSFDKVMAVWCGISKRYFNVVMRNCYCMQSIIKSSYFSIFWQWFSFRFWRHVLCWLVLKAACRHQSPFNVVGPTVHHEYIWEDPLCSFPWLLLFARSHIEA